MTKREAYIRVFGKEAIHLEGIDDWDSETDDTFDMELEVIKQMVERTLADGYVKGDIR